MVGRPVVSVTMGDPGGIGPEVIARALADDGVRGLASWRVHGIRAVLRGAARVCGVASPETLSGVTVVEAAGRGDGPWPARADAASGALSFAWVEAAIAECLAGVSAAVVTGPINKEAWALAGHERYPGHTELFAERCGSPRSAMMFLGPGLRVILATVHVPLRAVAGLVTRERVVEVIGLGAEACVRAGVARPRVAVCGLNPHAGEHGLLGAEDDAVIRPAVEEARSRGIEAHGPLPGDTVFLSALGGAYDLVVAMYHDQGLIPVKLLARDESVNVTVGLPIVRTSPDHGTAFDIAGRGVASAGSMMAAMRAAVAMVGRSGVAEIGR